MNNILIIDDDNELELDDSLGIIRLSSNSEELFTIDNIKVVCINRNIKYYDITQLVRLIERLVNFRNTQIVIISKWIKNYDKLSITSDKTYIHITKEEFNKTLIEELLLNITNEEIDQEIVKLINKDEIINKLVYSHNSKENMINRYMLGSSLSMNSIHETVSNFFNTLNTFNKNNIIILILKENNKTSSYSFIDNSVKKSCFDDFMKFCLHNHHDNFNGVNLEGISHNFICPISEKEFNTLDIDNKKISSYYYSPIYNDMAEPIGTVHVGNFINNYFNNNNVREKFTELFYRIGEPIDNAIKYKHAKDTREKNLNVFSKFIPIGVIKNLLKQGKIERGGEVRRICVLFSDIRSFTTISEKNSAEDVVRLLNNYFNVMVKCIRDQGGTIDKFIGDAIMAIFGAPDDLEELEKKAVIAAKNMISSLDKIDTNGIILPSMGFKIGVGLHVGNSIVGNIGSKEKKAYTSIGDISIIAEELEGLTKKYKTPILITKEVADFCESSTVDTVEIDGRTIELHSVLELK